MIYKKILCFFILIGSIFLFTSCSKEVDSLILFNKEPITKENFLNNSTEFIAGKRIYYLFMTQKPINGEFIRVRIVKREEKLDFALVNVVYSNDFRLKKDQVYYYNDYIILNNPGYYCMQVYFQDRLNAPFVIADFRVK